MFNSWLPESKDHLPLTWWKTHPIYLAAILALVGVAGAIASLVLGQSGMTYLAFSFDNAFKEFRLWTPLTYVLFNPFPLLTVLGCYLLWKCGEAVERHLGRRAFVRLLLLLVAASPLMITLLHAAGKHGLTCAGIMQLAFGVFIAFATLYPRVEISIIILTLEARVLAAVIVGISALLYLAGGDWVSLALLAANVGTAFAFIRYEQGGLKLPSMSMPSRPVKPTTVAWTTNAAKPAKQSKPKSPSVDDILDKISHHGMQSLTPEERRILDKASEEMKRRSG